MIFVFGIRDSGMAIGFRKRVLDDEGVRKGGWSGGGN